MPLVSDARVVGSGVMNARAFAVVKAKNVVVADESSSRHMDELVARRKRVRSIACIVSLLVVLAAVAVVVGIRMASTNKREDTVTPPPTIAPIDVPTVSPTFGPPFFTSHSQLLDAVDAYLRDNSSDTLTAARYGHPIGNWDVSRVTDFSDVFSSPRTLAIVRTFNEDLSGWNTSSAITMSNMFLRAQAFNQPIGNWDVSKVVNLRSTFRGASVFNQPLGGWNVSRVANMEITFKAALNFNQDLGAWDVSSVNDMDEMFWAAIRFNQDISSWNLASVTTMQHMFNNTERFNQNLCAWGNTLKEEAVVSGMFGHSICPSKTDPVWNGNKFGGSFCHVCQD